MRVCPQCGMRYPGEERFCFVDGAVLEAALDPRIGTTIAGRYVIEESIGEGGMAVVYRAHHKLVDRPCAIKIMNPVLARDRVVRERFRREARSAQALAHPNIIEIYDQGDTDDGTAYIVMELLDGRALSDEIAKGPIAVRRALPLMIQMARGIARAHDLGVIHRDLKPEHIFLVRREHGGELVKLLDFGIARSRSDSRLTNVGELFGTPQYMAPERVTSGDAGSSVDLYALGVIFFEMLTGRLPFDAGDPTTLLIKHLKEEPPSPSQFVTMPPELEQLTLRLLKKSPDERPVDAHALEDELVALAHLTGSSIPPEPQREPGSLRGPAKTLPSLSLNQWIGRLPVFEQMLTQAFGSKPPAELRDLLRELSDALAKFDQQRLAGVVEQHTLEAIEARGRDGRQRLGFAVDALGIDVSRARNELRAAQARTQELHTQVQAAIARYAEVHREVLQWEGRTAFSQPHAALVEAYRAASQAVEEWLNVHEEERIAIVESETCERTAADLEYQIQELRGALAQHEQRIDSDRRRAEGRLIELNGVVEGLESHVVGLAARFCAPLRSKQDLSGLFRQLEVENSEAARHMSSPPRLVG